MADREVLLRLFEATAGNSWNQRSGWATNKAVGYWFGVTTNAEGQVVAIKLRGNNLRGKKDSQGFPRALKLIVRTNCSMQHLSNYDVGDSRT